MQFKNDVELGQAKYSSLSASYAMPGTNIAVAAPRWVAPAARDYPPRGELCPYRTATRCPVLTQHMLLPGAPPYGGGAYGAPPPPGTKGRSSYAPATRCPVLT
eukprot:619676-Rhodomonas_salina.1